MGFFSSIAKIFKPVAKPLLDIGSTILSGKLAQKGVQQQNEGNIASAREAAAFNKDEAAINRKFQSQEAATARSFNATEAKINRDFQERLSNTAHAREIKDLRSAGLNPILSAKYGGSSTPSGSVATASAPSGSSATRQAARIEDEIGPAVSTALQTSRLKQEISNMRANEDLIKTQQTHERAKIANTAAKTESERMMPTLLERQASQSGAQAQKLIEETKNVKQQFELGKLTIQQAKQEIEGMKERLKYLRAQGKVNESTFGQWMMYLDRILPWAAEGRHYRPRGKR